MPCPQLFQYHSEGCYWPWSASEWGLEKREYPGENSIRTCYELMACLRPETIHSTMDWASSMGVNRVRRKNLIASVDWASAGLSLTTLEAQVRWEWMRWHPDILVQSQLNKVQIHDHDYSDQEKQEHWTTRMIFLGSSTYTEPQRQVMSAGWDHSESGAWHEKAEPAGGHTLEWAWRSAQEDERKGRNTCTLVTSTLWWRPKENQGVQHQVKWWRMSGREAGLSTQLVTVVMV